MIPHCEADKSRSDFFWHFQHVQACGIMIRIHLVGTGDYTLSNAIAGQQAFLQTLSTTHLPVLRPQKWYVIVVYQNRTFQMLNPATRDGTFSCIGRWRTGHREPLLRFVALRAASECQLRSQTLVAPVATPGGSGWDAPGSKSLPTNSQFLLEETAFGHVWANQQIDTRLGF